MNLHQSAVIDSEGNIPQTHLSGRWLVTARTCWVVLTLLVLTLNAISIPRAAALLQAVCQPGVLCVNSSRLASRRAFWRPTRSGGMWERR